MKNKTQKELKEILYANSKKYFRRDHQKRAWKYCNDQTRSEVYKELEALFETYAKKHNINHELGLWHHWRDFCNSFGIVSPKDISAELTNKIISSQNLGARE